MRSVSRGRSIQKNDRTVTQYYHRVRVVVAQWIGVTPPGILDVERVRPGEGKERWWRHGDCWRGL